MVEPSSSLQGTNTRPCSVCGAVGYEECLCSCSQCNCSVHVYCMRIFLKKVPEMWICEYCQLRNSDCTSSLNKRQKVKVSKVKFITADEAIKLTSGVTKEPLVRKYAAGRSHLASIMASKKISVDSETIGPKSSFKRPPDRSHRSHDRRVHFSIPTASPLRELKVPTKSKLRRADQLQAPKSAYKHRTPNREVETIVGKVSSTISLPRLSTPADLPDVNAEDATWKGSFRVLCSAASRLYEGFQAHPPLIVQRKAYEFSQKMPALLHFNFLPIRTLWMELFQDDPPDENDVGLYIFPSDVARSPTDFPSLLEAMDMNHTLMKIDIDGVELLIFTSKCLHVKSDNASRGSFLWGIFRQRKDTDNSDIDDLPPGFHEQRWLKQECKLNHHN